MIVATNIMIIIIIMIINIMVMTINHMVRLRRHLGGQRVLHGAASAPPRAGLYQ